jgi:hypothetical protein
LPDQSEFSDTLLVDTSITFIPAPSIQKEPAVAFDGDNFLVVWEDDRDGLHYCTDIFGARVTPDGIVLDSFGIPISRAADIQGHPAIAFDGTNFLVVWEDYRRRQYDIYGARVTPAGIVLDPSGIPVCQAAAYQYAPAVAFTGTGFLVVWRDYRNGYDIYGTRVTADGVVLDSTGIAISTAAHDQMEPAVAFDGANSLVVWQDERSGGRDLFGARVTPAGVVLDSMGIPISQAAGYQSAPAVAFDGTNFLVVWNDYRTGDGDIYGARVTPAGAVLDSAGIAIPRASVHQLYPAVAFDGTNFLVVWMEEPGDSFDIYAARVTSSGVVLDSIGIHISDARGDEWYPAVAYDSTNYLVVWGDGTSDIFGARVTPHGDLLDTSSIALTGAANTQQNPVVASDGSNYLVVWTDVRGADQDIYGARVTQAGVVLDPAGFAISQAVGYQNYPAVAFDGADYLVVWEDGRGGQFVPHIYGARITPSGVVLDTSGIPISNGGDLEGLPAVAFDGSNFLVVWERWYGSAPSDIYGARVTPDGIVLDPSGFAVSQASNYEYQPAVASDGTNSLVVWTDQRNPSFFDIYCARVTPAGAVLDPVGIPICQEEGYQQNPAVAFDGTYYLVAWTDERARHTGDTSDVYGARVTPTGMVLDYPLGIPVAQAEHNQELPDVAFDGSDFVVVWQDRRSGWYQDVYGALVSHAGVVFDSGPIVEQDGHQVHAALARGPGAQLLLVYQGWTTAAGGKVYNTDRIWGKLGPLLGLAEVAPNGEVPTRNSATVVHSVLFLPGASSSKPQAASWLLDISGRKVLELRPGPNDVSGFSPGVYFVREPSAASGKPSAVSVRKVVLAE